MINLKPKEIQRLFLNEKLLNRMLNSYKNIFERGNRINSESVSLVSTPPREMNTRIQLKVFHFL